MFIHLWKCCVPSSASEGRMWKRPSWKQQRGYTRTSKTAVWTWTLLSRGSSTNHLLRRGGALTPTASRPKKAAAANHRQELQTNRTDRWTDGQTEAGRYTEIHQALTCFLRVRQTQFRWITFNAVQPTVLTPNLRLVLKTKIWPSSTQSDITSFG